MIDTSVFQGKKATYFTLGCKLNFSETSTFGALLQEMGVVTAAKGERADLVLVNTCSVTDIADHKCRQAIHRLVRENPGAFVVVTGCYAQLSSEEVARIDGVSLVLGSNEKASLVQFLSEAWMDLRGERRVERGLKRGGMPASLSRRPRTLRRLPRAVRAATARAIS